MMRLLALTPRRCETPHCEREFVSLSHATCERCRHLAECVADARRERITAYWLDWSAERSERRRFEQAGGAQVERRAR